MKLNEIKKMLHLDYWNALEVISKDSKLTKTEIAKKCECSYGQCFLILKGMKEMDLITDNKAGKSCYVELTEKGIGLSGFFDVLRKIK